MASRIPPLSLYISVRVWISTQSCVEIFIVFPLCLSFFLFFFCTSSPRCTECTAPSLQVRGTFTPRLHRRILSSHFGHKQFIISRRDSRQRKIYFACLKIRVLALSRWLIAVKFRGVSWHMWPGYLSVDYARNWSEQYSNIEDERLR